MYKYLHITLSQPYFTYQLKLYREILSLDSCFHPLRLVTPFLVMLQASLVSHSFLLHKKMGRYRKELSVCYNHHCSTFERANSSPEAVVGGRGDENAAIIYHSEPRYIPLMFSI